MLQAESVPESVARPEVADEPQPDYLDMGSVPSPEAGGKVEQPLEVYSYFSRFCAMAWNLKTIFKFLFLRPFRLSHFSFSLFLLLLTPCSSFNKFFRLKLVLVKIYFVLFLFRK